MHNVWKSFILLLYSLGAPGLPPEASLPLKIAFAYIFLYAPLDPEGNVACKRVCKYPVCFEYRFLACDSAQHGTREPALVRGEPRATELPCTE